jgi:high affinity sulfate transporter 1
MPTAPAQTSRLYRFAPGLRSLLSYNLATDFRFDFLAGISVAAVALPVAIAYAELAGFPAEVGLYSCILPLVAYAIFGTSPQLIVNPDASACAIIAASVAPLAAGDPQMYASLSVTLTFIAGIFCIIASFLYLGVLADFLSKPILVGFLNGVAISIFLGQIGKILGFSVTAGGIFPRLFEVIQKLPQKHWVTLAVGGGSFVILYLSKKFVPRAPAALVAMILAGAAVALLHLDSHGVKILGKVPAGLPRLRFPTIRTADLPELTAEALGLALVLFSSGMLTARSFASKNGYEIDVDKEFAAFGAANIASALSQGFAVTGADSRTAMADSAGGRTQVTGLVAAAAIAVVLLYFTSPLQFIPTPTLGAVLVFAAISLVDVATLKELWPIDRREVYLSLLTTIGVAAVGAINAILVAVALAVIRFVKFTARPRDEILGTVEGIPGFHCIDRHEGAKTLPGLVMYRFGGPIMFFNCGYFAQRVLRIAEATPGIKWFVIDAIPITQIDVTGLDTIRTLYHTLESKGIRMLLAGRQTEYINWLKKTGLYRPEHEQLFYRTMRQAYRAFQQMPSASPESASDVAGSRADERPVVPD